ncbi:MAG TPA: DciA family protein [Candidatus Limnocylindrales bacterium]|jgi:hypothetical protein|nr:DciA family protein [Candidatus Limnocylindrales bacterium]
MTDRRRPMRRLGDVLPEVAGKLGIEAELRRARQTQAWARLVAERVPAAAGQSALLDVQPPVLVVSATSPLVGQELRLRGSELLRAFADLPDGARMVELRVVIRPFGSAGGARRGPV